MTSQLQFLDFLNAPASTSTNELLDEVLTRSRKVTGAEAGTIFMVRRLGRSKWLEATHFQNARIAPPVHSEPSSARDAARHPEIVAAASTGS